MKKALLVILILVTGSLTTATTYASDDWLLGEWILAHDPDGDTQDKITFLPKNKFVSTELSTGRTVDGMYFLRSDKVKISILNRGKIVSNLELTFDNTGDKLYLKSDVTGSTSYYEKIE